MRGKTAVLFICVMFCLATYSQNNTWGDIEYKGNAWVRNASRPNTITTGLGNTHLSVWASHGKYYNQAEKRWKWQRPNIFATNEDLFTQTIVVPYLIPMLESAGAIVFTPRERDWQKHEVIVDNDDMDKRWYKEDGEWYNTRGKGFAQHSGTYRDNENPFEAGTVRMAATTPDASKGSSLWYQPLLPEAGRYAVYVSYQSLPNSVSDAAYHVWHKGVETIFKVNQQMGGGTWVYLGTFDFGKGSSVANMVVLTNSSTERGVVTGDAVRFGGGMGNIERGDTTSMMPRAIEGARYYAQWAGAPAEVYRSKNGGDDYAEDINTRTYMTNWLAGGSVFMPALEGKKVPIELAIAVHSDAGYSKNKNSIIGSLAICTTNTNDFRFNSGITRMISNDFADTILTNVNRDIKAKYHNWSSRGIRDQNYAETRLPEVPSIILETLSHQNFNDMRYAQDPNFRFTLARAIYKSILKFVADEHGRKYTVEPLAPHGFRVEFEDKNTVKLSWEPTIDMLEPTSNATSYNIYTAKGNAGFDNGINVEGNSATIKLDQLTQHNFKVTAVNAGGESFPSETLSAFYQPNARKTVLVVNGFNRLATPYIIDNDSLQGFDITKDIGVSYGVTAGWAGKQRNFNKTKMGVDGANGLGYGGDELAGSFIAGNDFSYVEAHTKAIAAVNKYNVVSCSSEEIERGEVDLSDYDCVDLIFGLQKDDSLSLEHYKTFTPKMQTALAEYMKKHGRLIVSGLYIGEDMKSEREREFLQNVLKVEYAGKDSTLTDYIINKGGTDFGIIKNLNDKHYAAVNPEILLPAVNAESPFQYNNGSSAGVAYSDKNSRCFTIGFPFECIKTDDMRNIIMKEILDFLME